jgi:hypothetical protein
MQISIYKNGKLIQKRTNLLTISTRRKMMDILLGYASADREIKTLKLGTAGGSADENATDLTYEIYEVPYFYRVRTDNEVLTKFSFYAEDIGVGVEILELGIFGGPLGTTMLSRVLCGFELVAGAEYVIERRDTFEAG